IILFCVIICPGITPITSSNNDDELADFALAGTVNIFGSSSVLICIVFFCRIDSDDREDVFLIRMPETTLLILSPTMQLLVFVLSPSRKTSDILKESKSSNSIKSALKPGAIAPIFFNPKYLAVLIDAI